ncbi:putative protease IV sppA [Mycobacterium xenopi 3993]|nr:putative protease IV sppA [Mycobacterium xenopi 3993]
MRALARRVDTARHHGVPNGCVLEFDLQSMPPETGASTP